VYQVQKMLSRMIALPLIGVILLAVFFLAARLVLLQKERTAIEEPIQAAKTAPAAQEASWLGHTGCQEIGERQSEERARQVSVLDQKQFTTAVQSSEDPAVWNAPETVAAVYMKLLPESERRRRLAQLGVGPEWSEARIEALDIHNGAIRLRLGNRGILLTGDLERKKFRKALRAQFPEASLLLVRAVEGIFPNAPGLASGGDYQYKGDYTCKFDLSTLPKNVDVRCVCFTGNVGWGHSRVTGQWDASVRGAWMEFPFGIYEEIRFNPPVMEHSELPPGLMRTSSEDCTDEMCLWAEANAGNRAANPGGGQWGVIGGYTEWHVTGGVYEMRIEYELC
jgi:hypothetical protein